MSRNCESVCELEFAKEKYRDVLSQSKHVSADNNVPREELNSRMQDPVKYLKLCEELTKVLLSK